VCITALQNYKLLFTIDKWPVLFIIVLFEKNL